MAFLPEDWLIWPYSSLQHWPFYKWGCGLYIDLLMAWKKNCILCKGIQKHLLQASALLNTFPFPQPIFKDQFYLEQWFSGQSLQIQAVQLLHTVQTNIVMFEFKWKPQGFQKYFICHAGFWGMCISNDKIKSVRIFLFRGVEINHIRYGCRRLSIDAVADHNKW